MSRLKINFACGLYDQLIPLSSAEVQAEGIDLKHIAMESPRQIFDRMAGGLEFEAAEMSLSEFICRMGAGQCSFVALPVFPSRLFRHSYMAISRKSGIRKPKDLEGKRVGVSLYTMTAAVWLRGLLQHDFGVDLASIRWVQGAMNSAGTHGSPTVMPLLKPVNIEINKTGRSLSQLLAEGAIDATMGSTLPDTLFRNADVQRLFPDYRAVEKDYYRRTGISPIMHLVVIRRDIYEAHAFVAGSLYRAFCESKARAYARMRSAGVLLYMLPWLTSDIEEIDEVFGGDPWPYGVEPNRPTLETLVTYLAEQGLISAPIPFDHLFVPTEA